MNNLREHEWRHVLFVVFVANYPHKKNESEEIAKWLRSKFPRAIELGLFEIIEPPPTYYPPDLDHIRPTFNDSANRMRWRTKQNLGKLYS